MTKILYNPTKEEVDRARTEELQDNLSRSQKENFGLKSMLNRQQQRIAFLEEIIENARQGWSSKGNEFAIKEMIACMKSGKVTNKIQQES